MGIVEYEKNILRQKKIEVTALVALVKYGYKHHKGKALAKLERIAHPEELAAQINMMEKSEQATL
jgi:hypothetical protein